MLGVGIRRQPPRVQALSVATLTWRALTFDFASAEASRASLAAALGELTPAADRIVLRITLTGIASPAALAAIHAWLAPALAPSLVGQLRDETRVALTATELADLHLFRVTTAVVGLVILRFYL